MMARFFNDVGRFFGSLLRTSLTGFFFGVVWFIARRFAPEGVNPDTFGLGIALLIAIGRMEDSISRLRDSLGH